MLVRAWVGSGTEALRWSAGPDALQGMLAGHSTPKEGLRFSGKWVPLSVAPPPPLPQRG